MTTAAKESVREVEQAILCTLCYASGAGQAFHRVPIAVLPCKALPNGHEASSMETENRSMLRNSEIVQNEEIQAGGLPRTDSCVCTVHVQYWGKGRRTLHGALDAQVTFVCHPTCRASQNA